MLDTPGLMAAGSLAVFVGSDGDENPGSGSVVMDFSFAQAGDLGVIHAYAPSLTNGATASGWTRATYAWATPNAFLSVIMLKELDATDVASGVTVSGMGVTATAVGCAAYRGPKAAAVVGTAASDGSTTVSLSGFTTSSVHMGVVSVLHKFIDQATPTPPAGSIRRNVYSLGGFGCLALADISDPALYAGAAIAWTGLTATSDQANIVLELRDA